MTETEQHDTGSDTEPDTEPDTGTDAGTDTEQTDVGLEEAQAAWADAAREMLIGTAGRYHHVLQSKALAAGVQERTGITAVQRVHQWLGPVLDRVAADCARRGEPNLTALCVNTEGSVGKGYAETVTAHTGEVPEDPDAHAAVERLACHTHFEARGLPADGGTAMLTPRLSASRSRLRKIALEDRPVESCPECFMVLSAQGTCLNCA